MQLFNPKKYQNIDRSTPILIDENNLFSLLTLSNNTTDNQHPIFKTKHNYIQLFFNLKETSTVAFNMEHCAIELKNNESGMVYFNEEETNILFNLAPDSEIIAMLIPVQYFHSLFTTEENYLLNFDNFVIGKPIIETKATTPAQQVVLHQISKKPDNSPLNNLFLKAKAYELFSLYFSNTEDNSSDNCPFISNEDTMAQLKKAKDIVIENMADPPSLDELAKMVGLNIKKLKQGFKEVYGTPVFTFLLNYKLEFSKKLLLENKLNVNEIGNKVGYSTSSHFIAAFKRKFGITPKQFTKQNNA
ncbi:AraC-like DNA-binding protein [Wenyingzhuangia heitensis]|uniref:AraC-like DNA-binding protein n=1 Tax=Wenyingzhuangia heitensis TaxID=1487859 RepID=A0ABX0U979_9FLAO|nr:AraC family transcriptional regulator [Wenyingzhuangia heitensis]NIJ45394.1 AraC-like DNA-binding protein [Wenyingzhuangia heitensis]